MHLGAGFFIDDAEGLYVHPGMSHSVMSGLAAQAFSAVTPCASCPMRLETVDEHTPSPMQPLLATRFFMPPGCPGKGAAATASMWHGHAAMPEDPVPDITWSPFRHRGVRLPSPNYCSPAALGAVHGVSPVMRYAPVSAAQMTSLPLSFEHAMASDGGEAVSAGGAAAGGSYGDAAHRSWLCMRGVPRTASTDGEAWNAEDAAGAGALEVACAQMERGRGAGTVSRGQHPAAGRESALVRMMSRPRTVEGGDWSVRYAGVSRKQGLPGPAEGSASATGLPFLCESWCLLAWRRGRYLHSHANGSG